MTNDGPVGETPFNAEERYRIRKMLKAFDNVSPDDMQELRSLVQGSKVRRAVVRFIAGFLVILSTATGLFASLKGLFGGKAG